ncbi:MAG: hypothetical protein JEY97_14315 [Bacteroidales bacterium]|nr:hypothetical protein [Bacteroidales bacterium]
MNVLKCYINPLKCCNDTIKNFKCKLKPIIIEKTSGILTIFNLPNPINPLNPLDEWMYDFKLVARITLADKPQLLEVLGFLVRS